MEKFTTKLYKINYNGYCGGGSDVVSGRTILNKFPWIIKEFNLGHIDIKQIN